MKNLLRLGGAAVGGLFLASCVTYPYDTAFSSCEGEANACYRLCEDIPDEGGYIACQSHCDRDIDRCFDQAYSPYSSGYGYGYGSGYGYSSPWYGRYGSWYPNSGYYLSFNYYDRYGYRKKHHPHPGDWNDNPPNHPPSTPPQGRPNIPPGEREFDRPRKPNRYYRRDVPNNSAAGGSPSATPTPQPTYTPPPRQPRRVTPSEPQPTYTPPQGPGPTYTPPPETPPASSTPPPSRPYGERREPGDNGRRSGDNPQRDKD